MKGRALRLQKRQGHWNPGTFLQTAWIITPTSFHEGEYHLEILVVGSGQPPTNRWQIWFNLTKFLKGPLYCLDDPPTEQFCMIDLASVPETSGNTSDFRITSPAFVVMHLILFGSRYGGWVNVCQSVRGRSSWFWDLHIDYMPGSSKWPRLDPGLISDLHFGNQKVTLKKLVDLYRLPSLDIYAKKHDFFNTDPWIHDEFLGPPPEWVSRSIET